MSETDVTYQVIAILRGHTPEETVELAVRCWQHGFDLVEVPVQDEAGWEALTALSDQAGGRPFGAGTILSVPDAERAVRLGASALIMPGLDETVVQAARDMRVAPLPGVMTPSDVGRAARLGVRTCKLFPADVVGSGWIRAMHGPFPTMSFIAVGGIGVTNAGEFATAGAAGVAFGSSVVQVLDLDDPSGFVGELHELLASR